MTDPMHDHATSTRCHPASRRSGLLLALVLSILFWIVPSLAADLHVHFIDVGQGDSIFVVSPSGKKLLVDAGIHNQPDSGWNPFLYVRSLKERGVIPDLVIDYLVITHPHDDHYKGVRYLWEGQGGDFVIGTTLYSIPPSPGSMYWKAMQPVFKGSQTHGQVSARGPPIDLGPDVRCTVLYPPAPLTTSEKDPNNDSVVIEIRYGDVAFVLTGDASQKVERKVTVEKASHVVLKLGHHGSRTASDPAFLKAVQGDSHPFYVVISSNDRDGKGTTYGHPDKEPLEALHAMEDVVLYRTDLHGTIAFSTDGSIITAETQNMNVAENALWEPGTKSAQSRSIARGGPATTRKPAR